MFRGMFDDDETSCNTKYKDNTTCDADAKCAWCDASGSSGGVTTCHSLDNAKKLQKAAPAYQCDKVTLDEEDETESRF